MPHVSRHPLPKRAWHAIWQHFIQILQKSNPAKNKEILLVGLLSPTERTMLAKRLMVGLLYQSGWSAPQISHMLNMSTSSIYRIESEIDKNLAYKTLLKQLFPTRINPNDFTTPKSLWKFLTDHVLISYSKQYERLKSLPF